SARQLSAEPVGAAAHRGRLHGAQAPPAGRQGAIFGDRLLSHRRHGGGCVLCKRGRVQLPPRRRGDAPALAAGSVRSAARRPPRLRLPIRAGAAGAVAAAGLLALAVAMGIGRFAFTPILPMMQQDAGVSIAMGGWLASANYIGYLLGALSVMGLRMRATSAIRAGLLTIGLATLVMGLESGLVWWLALRAIAGVASAWVLINVSAWCLERLPALGPPGVMNTGVSGRGARLVLAGW